MKQHRLLVLILISILMMVFLLSGCGESEKEPLAVGTYDAGAYEIEIPESYEEKCFAEYENGKLDIYDAKTYETSGGLLVSIVEYTDDSYKEHRVDEGYIHDDYYDVLGEIGGVKYVAIYPIQAQYNITNISEYYRYTKLLSKVDDIVNSFKMK